MSIPKFVCGSLFATWFLASVTYGQALPVGSEFQVNVGGSGKQYQQEVASDAVGNFIVVWTNDGHSVVGRRFSSAGTPVSGDIPISTVSTARDHPAVASGSGGDSMVVWRSGDQDGDGSGIYARRFASSGAFAGSEFQVNGDTVGDQDFPVIVAGTAGFIVAWEDQNPPAAIVARRFDGSGAPIGTEFRVNTYTADPPSQAAIAADPSGRFVVVWASYQDGDYGGVFAQQFGSDGTPFGSEFQVNSFTPGYQYEPAVAKDAAGNFVVAWSSYYRHGYSYIFDSEVRARRFSSAGAPLGTEFTVATDSYGYPDVATEPGGGFVITWNDECGGFCDFDVVARRFSADAAPIGDQFRVNTTTRYPQKRARLAMDSEGDFIVVWMNDDGQFITNYDVFAQRYATTTTTPICSGGTVAADAQLKLNKLAAPAGDEKIGFKGKLIFPANKPSAFNPALDGVQLLVEDSGAGNAVVFEMSHRTLAIPGGPGCGSDDGWKVNGAGTTFVYKNHTDALPPACTPGSANGLSLIKLKDKRDKRGFISFKVKVKGATLPGTIVGPLRTTLVTSAAASASAAGDCGAQSGASCTFAGTSIKCQ